MNEIKIYQYQNNDVTFQLDNGDVMVNLTEMAKPFGKEPHSFLRTKPTRRFIEALKETTPNICGVTTVNGGTNPGTWAHQKLALKFAGWLDPRFELWVYDRIEELLKSGYTKLDSISVKDLAKMLLQSEEEKELLEQNHQIQSEQLAIQEKIIHDQEPRVLFSQSVEASKSSILVAELAKLLTQNGVDMGQNRLFTWLRDHGYLGNRGSYYNKPTQSAMEMGLFDLKKVTICHSDGSVRVESTPKVTGKGQIYFINKFLKQLQPA